LVALVLALTPAAPAAAVQWGIVAGGASQGLDNGISEGLAMSMAHQEEVDEREMLREQSGLPKLTRMQTLEQHSDEIFQNLMGILNKEKN
jgi:hypothetical protein